MKTISIIISFFLIRLKEGFASYNFITSFIIQFLKYNKWNKTKLSYFSYIPTSSKRNLFFFFCIYLICITRQSNRIKDHCLLHSFKFFFFLLWHNKRRLDLHGAATTRKLCKCNLIETLSVVDREKWTAISRRNRTLDRSFSARETECAHRSSRDEENRNRIKSRFVGPINTVRVSYVERNWEQCA